MKLPGLLLPIFQEKPPAWQKNNINALWENRFVGSIQLFDYPLNPVAFDCTTKFSANAGAYPAPCKAVVCPADSKVRKPDLFPLSEYPAKIPAAS